MTYTAVAVANFFITHAKACGAEPLTQMKLQKLVYFAHGWHLGLRDAPLIVETVEAWDYGPVVRDLYHELKKYGAGPITDCITDVQSSSGGFVVVCPTVTDAETQDFLRRVWDVYGRFSAVELSAMTHRPDSPWSIVRNKYQGKRGPDIPDPDLTIYFKELAKQNAARATPAAAR